MKKCTNILIRDIACAKCGEQIPQGSPYFRPSHQRHGRVYCPACHEGLYL